MKNRPIFEVLMVLTILFVSNHAHSQSNFWQQTNGPFGGTVNSLAVNSSGDIFAGIDNGGDFRCSKTESFVGHRVE